MRAGTVGETAARTWVLENGSSRSEGAEWNGLTVWSINTVSMSAMKRSKACRYQAAEETKWIGSDRPSAVAGLAQRRWRRDRLDARGP